MIGWKCNLCSHIYDETKNSIKWEDAPEDWACPICGSPKSSFTVIKEEKQTLEIANEPKDIAFEKYECGLCSFIYDEAAEDIPWIDLSPDWVCPVCGSVKTSFVSLGRGSIGEIQISEKAEIADNYLGEWQRASDSFELNMADIHKISTTGKPISEPMRTKVPTFSWDDILFKGAQLFKLPLNKSRPVQTRTIIVPERKPLILVDLCSGMKMLH